MKPQLMRAAAAGMVVMMLAGTFPITSFAAVENGWEEVDGKYYWYENGVKQGYKENDLSYRGNWYENGVRQGYDANNPGYRGKEIYDPGSDAWYLPDISFLSGCVVIRMTQKPMASYFSCSVMIYRT